MMTFAHLVTTATGGHAPYDYQSGLAERGLPDVLRAPTGSGKSLAATMPWLYRRRFHPDPAVRDATPRWLVVVLPQRSLVEQTADAVRTWRGRLAIDLPVHVLMGGESSEDRDWRMDPGTERIFVGTQDMVLSRLLMRGYAEPRGRWPGTFGLLHNDVQFVFDEVQLMGPGLPTSVQLQGLREALGTVRPCHTMWMSATLDVEALSTVDFRRDLRISELTDADRTGELLRRLEATRTVQRLDMGEPDAKRYPVALARAILETHRPGTRTIAVMNTVDRVTQVMEALVALRPAADVVMLHSRFRPGDRRIQTEAALAPPGPSGLIVIATQVLEAGVDVTSTNLITESAPWSSIVQRAGRCNRDGRADGARLLWVAPPPGRTSHLPYAVDDVRHSEESLASLEGTAMTGEGLAAASGDVSRPVYPVLRRRDLLGLFDTGADMFGNDVDVSPFIRDADDTSVFLAWRPFPLDENAPAPAREELCPAPIGEVRKLIDDRARGVLHDQRRGEWRSAGREDVRPGATLVLAAAKGGYLPDRGFAPGSRTAVVPVAVARPVRPEALDADPLSAQHTGRWVSLTEHLADTEREAEAVLTSLASDGVDPGVRRAVVLSARFHDLGKAHPTFQASLAKANPHAPPPADGGPWAKSPGNGRLRHEPPHFRHELVSALVLLRDNGLVDAVEERDLVAYLAAAHHGNVRLTVRGHPDENDQRVLGVTDGDVTIPVEVPGFGVLPAQPIALDPARLGAGSLTARALSLRDRLGPFRLAWCEAVVVAADWRASAGYVTAGTDRASNLSEALA
ncbi:MAG: CRISPR-associated endonuclease Cas3'' [Actinomycetia bacterium]|nr:CRISPR-associated endonuclease Cas3'' [Actinomycetes bacterium]